MKHVKVHVTQEVEGIEVYGVTFTQDAKHDFVYVYNHIRLIDRDARDSQPGVRRWCIEFPGGAFVGNSPEYCVDQLRNLALDVIATHWVEPEPENPPSEPRRRKEYDLPF